MKAYPVFLLILLVIAGCNTAEIDDQKPVIDLTAAVTFPVSCDTIYLGETFTWKVHFSDNVELGSYSLEVHHNFDHHAHSTEVEDCTVDQESAPVNPFHLIMDFDIPPGVQEFEVDQDISLPSSDANGEFDPGDYHFFISLTDREGWSAQKGLNVKILKREEGLP